MNVNLPSWSAAPMPSAQALAYVYSEDEPGRRTAAKLLTKDEARRMGVNFAQVPGLPLPAT